MAIIDILARLGTRAVNAINARPGFLLDSLRGRPAAMSAADIVFVCHDRNHVRLMAPVAAALSGRARFRFAHVYERAGDAAVIEFARRSIAAISMREVESTLTSNSVLVVGNDWWPNQIADFLRSAHSVGATSVGIVEGARFAWPGKYAAVEHVFAYGASSMGLFRQPVQIVGSPTIEAAFHDTAITNESNLVGINYKLMDIDINTRTQWFGSVTSACDQLGLPYAVSKHPNDRLPHAHIAFEEIDDVLRRAAVLVSRPSTTVYEALARGRPVVLFPIRGEMLCEFEEPMGAFSIAHEPGQLRPMIMEALENMSSQLSRSKAFLERHVEIGAPGSAVRRIASGLLEVAAKRSGGTSTASAT